MHIAAAHHPPTTRRHYPAGQRMKGVVDRLFARQNPGAMSLSRPAPARPISPWRIGVEAIRKPARSVFFSSLVDLVTSLARAEREGALRDESRYLCRLDLVIVDELGYLPFSPGRRQLLFHLVSTLYERRLDLSPRTSPSPSGRDVFGDSTLS